MFGVLGMMVMVSSHSFITIFIGLEVMSLSIYILCGLMRGNLKSVEASLKYFLLGAFATAFSPLRHGPDLWLHRDYRCC